MFVVLVYTVSSMLSTMMSAEKKMNYSSFKSTMREEMYEVKPSEARFVSCFSIAKNMVEQLSRDEMLSSEEKVMRVLNEVCQFPDSIQHTPKSTIFSRDFAGYGDFKNGFRLHMNPTTPVVVWEDGGYDNSLKCNLKVVVELVDRKRVVSSFTYTLETKKIVTNSPPIKCDKPKEIGEIRGGELLVGGPKESKKKIKE